MKMQHFLLRASLGLLCATSGASAQGVVSQMGGFLEQVRSVPVAQATAADPLSQFLQQEPEPPTFVVAPTVAVATPATPSFQVPAAPETAQMFTTASAQIQNAHLPAKGLLSLRSMRVANAGSQGSKIFFGTGSEFSVGTDSAGNFAVQGASAAAPLLNLDSQDTLHLGSAKVETQSLNAVNGIAVRGVKQWQLVYSEDFSLPATGWSRGDITQCGGVFMLGGYCKFSRGEVNKTFAGLPPHKQLKVVASYHFIDRWIGETGFMKLNVGQSDCAVPVWSEQHTQGAGSNGLNLCGNAGVPEGKFSAAVDVTVPHNKASVSVTFGSTMADTDACDESWGVSGVEIYVRN